MISNTELEECVEDRRSASIIGLMNDERYNETANSGNMRIMAGGFCFNEEPSRQSSKEFKGLCWFRNN